MMCYAVPAMILSVDGEHASVDYGGLKKDINVSFVEGITPGDFVLIHAGFAIEKVSKARAEASFSLIRSLSEIDP